MESLRADICRVGRSLFERGYVHATAGNISVRLPQEQGFLITPSDACLGFLEASQLAHVATGGEQLTGAPASKTLALHRAIYAAEPSAQCVIHTHSTNLVALTLAGVRSHQGPQAEDTRHPPAEGVKEPGGGPAFPWQDILPPITPYFVMKVGHVPLIAYRRPGDPAVANDVTRAIESAHALGQTLRAVMLERLGPNVWHSSPAAAMATLEELEETAKLWLMTQPRPAPLNGAQIDELRSAFGATW